MSGPLPPCPHCGLTPLEIAHRGELAYYRHAETWVRYCVDGLRGEG